MNPIKLLIKRIKAYTEGNEKSYFLDPNDPYFDTKAKDTADTFEDMFDKPNNPKISIVKPHNFEKEKEILERRKEWNFHKSSQAMETKKYAALFAKHHKPETDILLKSAANIGAAEIENARRFSMFENNDRQLGKEIDTKIEDWYNTIYGTAPLRRDGTGRQIEPAIKIHPRSSGKLSTKDGLDLEQSLTKLAERMSEINTDNTSETGITALQKSLNNLGANPPLKIDGQLGPKTTLQTRRQLANNGYFPLIRKLS